jgi:hypothetical protein
MPMTDRATSQLNFVRQQGFHEGAEAAPDACVCRYPALMFQPRVIGVLVLMGLALQAWSWFLALSLLLWWNVALPRFNPFDAIYGRLVSKPEGVPRPEPARAPRRFAQGMAGTFMLAVATSLYCGWPVAAWIFEGFVVLALGLLIFGRFCMGSYIFLLVTGQATLANRTLPWSRGESPGPTADEPGKT